MAGPMYNGGDQVHNVNLTGYSEPDALQRLLVLIDRALEDDIIRTDRGDHIFDQFTITIGGTSVAFYIGGPQAEGLYAFVNHICAENLYGCDFENCIIKGW